MTEWMNLTEGEFYYIEAKYLQFAGADHMTVSVEIEDENLVPGHHHTMKEVQRLLIT